MVHDRATMDIMRAAVLATIIMLLAGSAEKQDRYCMYVDLCTVYWHYLLLVWAVLFYLLLTT